MAVFLPKKNKSTQFKFDEPPAALKESGASERVGPFVSTQEFIFSRYRVPMPIAKGVKVLAIEDRKDRVLVEFQKGTCLYMESATFDANFRRA